MISSLNLDHLPLEQLHSLAAQLLSQVDSLGQQVTKLKR